jgi:fumarate reductase flavoprotein subunit
LLHGGGTEDASVMRAAMQEIMTEQGRHLPHRRRLLAKAVEELQVLLVRSRHIGLRNKAPGANPELVTAYRVQKMLKLALCVAYGASAAHRKPRRALPRGLPPPRRCQWLKRTLATWPNGHDTCRR